MTVETHIVDWAGDLAVKVGVPDTHSTRSALAAWALATSRAEVVDSLDYLFAVAGEDQAPVVLTDDQQRVRTSLATGADADTIARNVANAGAADFRDFVRHVIDGDHSAFDPDDIAAAVRADVVIAEQRQAAEDAAPATRGDMRELTDAIGALVAELRATRVPNGGNGYAVSAGVSGGAGGRGYAGTTAPAKKTATSRKTSPPRKAAAKKSTPRKAAAKKTAPPRKAAAKTAPPASPAPTD